MLTKTYVLWKLQGYQGTEVINFNLPVGTSNRWGQALKDQFQNENEPENIGSSDSEIELGEKK